MLQLFEEEKEKAVAYYRHSAEDKQENSVLIQSKDTEKLLAEHNVELIHWDADEGVSGLDAKRPGFERLINDYVLNPDAPKFTYVCVYDVSRWGRFQDEDEAGYWEFLCRKHGKKVIYVSHGWPQDNEESNMINGLRKSIERYAAAEYSRKLSRDVIKGCIEVSEQGYSAGGMAPFGYVRVLLSEDRKRLGILKRGEHKAIANQRVTFEPATNGEAEIVKRIFREFINQGSYPDEIAARLNKAGVKTPTGKQWQPESIVRILRNETYTGTRIYNRTWSRLKKQKRRNPESEWTRCPNAHRSLVTPEVFQMTKERLRYLRPRADKLIVRKYHSVESYVWKFIEEQLKAYTDDQKFFIRHNFPAIFGTIYKLGDKKRSCFYLPSQTRKTGEVLAFSIDPTTDKANLSEINLYESESLGNSGFLIVDQNNKQSLDQEETKMAVKNICDTLIEQHCPWLKTESLTAV